MKHRTNALFFLVCLAASLIYCTSSHAVGEDLRDRAAKALENFKDLKLICEVTYKNTAELKKISSDMAKQYDVKTTTIMYKVPDMLKIEGKLGLVTTRIVINGNTKAFVVPTLGINKKYDLKKEPHKRQSDFDIGIFSNSIWRHNIVRSVDVVQGADGPQYKVVFVRSNARQKNIACWVDRDTLKLMKVEKYDKGGSLIQRIIYSNHRRFGNCVWLPINVDVYNGNGRLAGSTEYKGIQVNTGIPDSEFKI